MRSALAITMLAIVPLAARADSKSVLVIPQVGAPLHCDGELDEVAWRTPARTGAFVDATGEKAAPYSDARFLRDDKYLYVALYAADEDIRSTDAFVLDLASGRGHTRIRFMAGGKLAPELKGAKIAVDTDGSIDQPQNDDEEWVVEAALPLADLPFAADGSVSARLERCDVTKDHVRRCGRWAGTIVKR